MNKLSKYFLVSGVLFGLVVPNLVFAIVGTGLFDKFKAVYLGIAEKYGTLFVIIVIFLIVYLIALALLLLFAHLLEWIIHNQAEWLTLEGNVLVETGFEIAIGMANMILILLFIVIAFAIILKIESFEVKKTLPRLIIVALLMNFSLLFVGMAIDISTIALNTILHVGGGAEENGAEGIVVLETMTGLIGAGTGVITVIAAKFGVSAITKAIPFTGPFKKIAAVAGFVALFGPQIITWVMQLFVMSIMIAILFLYVLVFAARVVVVQMLAMIAPLAFLCLILPQTKKYWSQWLNAIIGWIFLGVPLLFFLVLGLRAAHEIAPDLGDRAGIIVPGLGWGILIDMISFYLFLAIFLGAALMISKTMMPVGAQAVISSVQGMAKTAVGVAGGIGLAKGFGKAAAGAGVEAEKLDEKEASGKKLTTGEKVTQWAGHASKKAYNLAGTTPQAQDLRYAGESAPRFKDLASGDSSDIETLNTLPLDHPGRVGRAMALADAGKQEHILNEDKNAVIDDKDSSAIRATCQANLNEIAPDPDGKTFKEKREELQKRADKDVKEQTETVESLKNDPDTKPKELEEEQELLSYAIKKQKKVKEEISNLNIAERITNSLSKKTDEEGKPREEKERRTEAFQKMFPKKQEDMEHLSPTTGFARTMIEANIPVYQMAALTRAQGAEFAKALREAIQEIGGGKGASSDSIAQKLFEIRSDLAKYMVTCPTAEITTSPDIMNALERVMSKGKSSPTPPPIRSSKEVVEDGGRTYIETEGGILAPPNYPRKKTNSQD